MKVYFDTNIYSKVVDHGELNSLTKYIRENSLSVPFSDFVVQEMYLISDRKKQEAEYFALGSISNYIDAPLSQKVAEEFLSEVRRCRPQWLLPAIREDSKVNQYLSLRDAMWRQMKNGIFEIVDHRAACDPLSRPAARKDLAEHQKYLRSIRARGLQIVQFRTDTGEITKRLREVKTHEDKWREDFLRYWSDSLRLRSAGMVDMQFFTDAHLWPLSKFFEYHYEEFCLVDVLEENIPRNVIRGLIWYAQADLKIELGNSGDTRHAVCLPDMDAFVTADKNFYSIIQEVEKYHKFRAKPVFIVRDEPLIPQLDAALSEN